MKIIQKIQHISKVSVSVYKIPTDSPESDGTFEWNETTMVLVQIEAEGKMGIGFTYAHEAVAKIIEVSFMPLLENASVFEGAFLWERMLNAVRNTGRRGVAANAISAVDMALWDLKARILEVPLCQLWGMARDSVPVYGSGGFTSYSRIQLAQQFEHWGIQGINKFKMKVGRNPDEDLKRVKDAREIIGPKATLMVDANGAYTRKQALDFSHRFHEYGVEWFEEPVSSDDLEGLRLLRDHAPAGMDIAAGEYGYDADYFRCMLEAGSVDILQADMTRCCGFTGFFQASAVARAFHIPLSSHTAPYAHLHACLGIEQVCHMEYFHDHVRIEEMFFEGLPFLKDGNLYPNLGDQGSGIQLKVKDVERYLLVHKEKVYE